MCCLVEICFFVPSESAAVTFDCAKNTAINKSEAAQYLKNVQSRYNLITSLTAQFIQKSQFVAGMEVEEQSSGTLYFQRRAKMRWEYKTPTLQQFVSDGETVWFYQPELNQVTLQDVTNSFDSELPVSFLIGLGNLEDEFQVAKACKDSQGIVLELQPKKAQANLNVFHLVVDPKDFSPIGAKVVDAGGNETTIQLVKRDFNKKLAETLFTFEIPRGVLPIDNRQSISFSNNAASSNSAVAEKNLLPKNK